MEKIIQKVESILQYISQDMEIKFQIEGRVFSICKGRYTNWFSQISHITMCEEFYDNMQVCYAIFISREENIIDNLRNYLYKGEKNEIL